MTSAIRLFSMTMSLGPLAGVPLPSITMALWISRRRTRWPLAGVCAMTEQASERAARETIGVRDMGTIVSRYGQGSNRRTGNRPGPNPGPKGHPPRGAKSAPWDGQGSRWQPINCVSPSAVLCIGTWEKTPMAYVIAEPCIGTKDTACVDACPVDCIHPKKDEPAYADAELLYIDPVECIDCGACVPVCPVSAIFALDDLPEKWSEFTAKNAAYYGK